MKIRNNYKISIALTFCSLLIYRGETVLFVFFFLAVLCIIVPVFGDFLYDKLSKAGIYIGNKLAKITLFFVWIITVLPIGVLMKLIGRDRLRLKRPDVKSYWIDNKNQSIDYEYQF